MVVLSSNRNHGPDHGQLCVRVTLEGGFLARASRERLLCLPSNLEIQVKDIRLDWDSVDFARTGETVDLSIGIRKDKNFEKISKGSVICCRFFPMPLVKK
jgi:hypothetical protein